MQEFLDLLITLGPWGMLISSVLAGSVLPFSSEVVLIGLLAAGASPWGLFLTASFGNVLGAAINFGVGRAGKERWITKYLHVKPEQLARGQQWVRRYGSVIGLLAWVPLLGSVITVALGYMRAPWGRSFLYITVGKVARYWILMQAYLLI